MVNQNICLCLRLTLVKTMLFIKMKMLVLTLKVNLSCLQLSNHLSYSWINVEHYYIAIYYITCLHKRSHLKPSGFGRLPCICHFNKDIAMEGQTRRSVVTSIVSLHSFCT